MALRGRARRFLGKALLLGGVLCLFRSPAEAELRATVLRPVVSEFDPGGLDVSGS